MATMDIFKNSAFSMTSLTGTIEKMAYVPQTLGQLNIFEPMPTRTRSVFVERRENGVSLIPTSATGAPPEELVKDDRDLVTLRTTRLAKAFTLYAAEIQDIRQFGSETELMQVQAEYLRRMAQVRQDLDLTHEYHRLGALQGKLLDSDGTTVIYNYFTEFGITEPATVEFEFSDATFNVRLACHALIRAMVRGSGGAITPASTIHALVGDNFFDQLIEHPMVKTSYLNWQAAAELRSNKAFGDFEFGGITWHNYRGTDDNSTVAIPTNGAHFFPVNARGVFKKAMAPAEFGPYINTPGVDVYALNILDRDRQAWTRGEQYSYPLYICQRPDCIRKGLAN